jgi:DNA repair exonuclease SbcCD ATPase subunit
VAKLPFRSSDRETLLEMQRSAPPPRPRSIKADVLPAAEAIVLKLLEKDRRRRFQDAHHLHEELKALQRSLPSTAWEVGSGGELAPPPPPPPPQSPGVIEWANRAAIFSRMVSRASAWDLAARATKLEGEVASHTRKLESLERRGRALRAEIGRKVEELAHEESRALRDAAAEQQEAARLREQLQIAERNAQLAKGQADQAAAGGQPAQLREREQKASVKDAHARDLRRQIEELRAQLSRYAEALEEDLAQGREKVAVRTRDGLAFEKSFSEVSSALLGHLKAKPEARDLLQELMENMHGPAITNKGGSGGGSESRGPGM